ncbi:S-layer homology domain-containing protein [Paenibacillus alba]|uniref:S-layer homology domain-containing protein n=1 Tax=Paenibacillus alba TaxID=1197127 RepID=A0ABU6G0Q4_9BACL|nr:S-layer homology domain-containing protein [Paenibacillus alba]MEC0227751.1 S-layer homology domain-containing protein [Paenibacillus alba]
MVKKVCLYFLCAVLVLSTVQFAWWKSAAAFASADTSRMIPVWYMSFAGLPDVEYGLDSNVFHQGSHSLKIAYHSDKASNVYMNISQTESVKPNTRYDLSMWVKGSNMKGVSFGANWEPRTSVGSGSFDWKKVTASYTTKSNETTLAFRILIEDKSKAVWLDELTLKETNTEHNLLRNGGFDSIQENISLNGFENLSAWTTAGTGGTTVVESVYDLHTEGEKAAKLTFAKTSSQTDQMSYVWSIAPELNLSQASTVTMDVYPLSQTTSGNEPLYMKVKDVSGTVSEVQLPKLLANRWNGVKLDFANSAVRNRIAEISLYTKTGPSATGWDNRTSVSYVVDQLNAVILKQVQPVTSSPEPGGILPGSLVALSTATEGATIRYTTDGSDPVTSGTKQTYTTPFPVASGVTVKAYGQKDGYEASAVAVLPYTLGTGAAGETLEYWDTFKAKLGGGTHVPVFWAEGLVMDGSLEDWEKYTGISLPTAGTTQNQISGWAGGEDLSMNARFAYDDDYFYISAKVRDNVHYSIAGADMWMGDSVQIAFSEDGVYGAEYGFNLLNGETQVWRWKDGSANIGKEAVTAKAVVNGNDTFYEAKIPWEAIFASKPAEGPISFSMLVNDNDGEGRRGWLEWTSGIGRVKDGKQLASLYRVPAQDPWSFWLDIPRTAETEKEIAYNLNLVNYSNEAKTISLRSELLGLDSEVTVPAGMVLTKEGHCVIADKGSYRTIVSAAEQTTGISRQFPASIDVEIGAGQLNNGLDAISAKLPALEGMLLQAEEQGLSTDYERINYTTIKDFIAYGKEDVGQGALTRAYYVMETLDSLYDEAMTNLLGYLNGTLTPKAAPRYVTGELERTEYGFRGLTRVRSTGEEEVRSVFLNGYGHFNQVRKDIAKFQDFGTNVIQIEIGPHRVITEKEGYIPQYSSGGSAFGSVEVDKAVHHSGGQSLKIVNTSPKQPNMYKYVSQVMLVKPNTTYQIRAWVKGGNVRNAWFPGNAGWNLRQALPTGTYDWQEVSYTYKTGSAETAFSLVFLSENEQILWLDDLSMTELGGNENLVQNAGFEETMNWDTTDPAKDYFGATDYLKANVVEVLKNAEANNIAVNLLLSPHYFPDWILKKNPGLKSNNAGNIKFVIGQPKAKEVIEDYLRTVIPLVKDYKSLLTVTITNEPVYQTNRDSYYLPAWHDYLKELYGDDLVELNQVYGKSYTSFEQIQMPSAIAATPIEYDWVTFNNKVFSDWHQWMADIIHEMAPDLPVQSKTMAKLQESLNWGVDYEQFSSFSQINGNDAYNVIGDGPDGFIKELSFYDMQRSFHPAPIFNSEHHFIKDGDDQYIPEQAKRVRAILWQGAIHGKSASTNWVWERTYDTTSDFMGSLLHRPDVVADIGRTNHDLNRLAEEVTALQDVKSQVAILYSSASGIYNNASEDTLRKSYAALAYSGQRISFVSEKQAAQGGLDGYKLLIVPAAAHVNASTLAAVKAFSEAGGKVVLIGEESLSRNEHDQPLSDGLHDAVVSRAIIMPSIYGAGKLVSPSVEEIRTAVLPVLEQMNTLPVCVTDAATGSLVTDVGWQTAVHKGRLLLNLVNYSLEAKRVSVLREERPAGISKELIADVSLNASDLELAPFTPILLDLGSSASVNKSVLSGSPNRVLADGISMATIKLELKDKDGNAVTTAASIQLAASLGQLSPIVEENGVYTATLTSTEAGTAIVEASVDGVQLPRTVQFVFYKPSQQSSSSNVPPVSSVTRGKLTLAAGEAGDVGLGEEVRLHIPAGSLNTSVRIAIEKLYDIKGLTVRAPGTFLSPVYEITKDVEGPIAQAVTLTLQFKPEEIKDGQKASIFYYNEKVQEWVEIGGTVIGNAITVQIDHFTKFAVFAMASKPDLQGTTNNPADLPWDIEGHWAESGIREAFAQGWVNGYEDQAFRPDEPVTREEFLVFLVRAMKPSASGGNLDFADSGAISTWAKQAVADAVYAGWLEGYEDSTIRPQTFISRAEMTVLLMRTAGQAASQSPELAKGFSDHADIPQWAAGYVYEATRKGVIEGDGEQFHPAEQTTRAETVTAILRLISLKGTADTGSKLTR